MGEFYQGVGHGAHQKGRSGSALGLGPSDFEFQRNIKTTRGFAEENYGTSYLNSGAQSQDP